MERREPERIADVLRKVLEESSLQTRMEELKAASVWSIVVGEGISNLTSKPYVNKGVMTVGVPNASLRQELYMNRTRLREIINRHVGKEIITELRFTS